MRSEAVGDFIVLECLNFFLDCSSLYGTLRNFELCFLRMADFALDLFSRILSISFCFYLRLALIASILSVASSRIFFMLKY